MNSQNKSLFIQSVFLMVAYLSFLMWPSIACSEDVYIDISNHNYNPPKLEFSQDNIGYLLSWWLPENGSETLIKLLLGHCSVFDENGKPVDALTDDGKFLKEAWIRRFPKIAGKQKWIDFIKETENLPGRDSHLAPSGWIVSGWRFGVRIIPRAQKKMNEIWKVQLWELYPRHMVWTKDLPPAWGFVCLADTFTCMGKEYLLVASRHEKAFVISMATGELVSEISYGPCDHETFCTGGVILNANKCWIAVSSAISTKIRIISLKPPYEIISELNFGPKQRDITADILGIYGNGRYMVIEFDSYYDGKYKLTEIYDTHTWKRCWQGKCPSLVLSSDGTKMAFIKDNAIVIKQLNLN